MKKSTLNSGTVTVKLGGASHKLAATLGAALAINDQYGNMLVAHDAVARADVRAIIFVIATGINYLEPSDEKIAEAIFKDGFDKFSNPAGDYLNLLFTGSNDKPEEGGTTDANPPKSSADTKTT